jgi:acyl-coenzyme A thioesterase PaaI-like protein
MTARFDPTSRLDDGDLSPDVAAARRSGDAARRVIGALIATHAPAEVLDTATRHLDAAADVLAPYVATSRYEGTPGLRVSPTTDPVLFEHHPLLGPANPLAPPLVLDHLDDGIVATATYDHRHEGMPGKVHGGVLASAFDLVLAAAAAHVAQRPAPTGTLSIRYRRPTPLNVQLRYTATAERTGERTLRATGMVSAGDEVTAEAEGIFVAARDEVLPAVGRADT